MAHAGEPPRFEMLGPLRAWRGGLEVDLGWPRQRAVLAALLLRAGKVVSRDGIIDGVWGVRPPASAPNLVHTYVSRLRKALEPERMHRSPGRLLVARGDGYLLQLTQDHLDLAVFERNLRLAVQAHAAGDPAGAVGALDAALGLWRGTPLAGLEGPLVEAARSRLSELWLTAVEDRAEAMLAMGRPGNLIAELSALVREHPFRERHRALLMLALHRSGRRAEALRLFTDTRRLLVEELGIEPDARLQKLHRDILAGTDIVAGHIEISHPAPRNAEPLVPRQLPPQRHFAGRSAELDALAVLIEQNARPGGTVLITAIQGTAGIGKTALALHWAHQLADRYVDGQLYVNLRGFDPGGPPRTPGQVVRGFLDALQVSQQQIPGRLDAQLALYRSLVADRRMLIVLDNAADHEQVRPLLPSAPGCLVVVTSRSQLASLVVAEGAYPMTLDLLTFDDARDLLGQRLGTARLEAEATAVNAIITACARLPLALAVVAARASMHPRFPLSALAAELRQAHGGLDAFGGADPDTGLRAVFSWSYQQLSTDAANLFRLMGLHPGADLATPAAASLAGIPLRQAQSLLHELVQAHLLDEHKLGRYTCHDLLRAYAREQSQSMSAVDQHETVHRMLDHYLHTAHRASQLLNPYRHTITVNPPRDTTTPQVFADHTQALSWFAAEHHILLNAIEQAAGTGFDGHAWQLAWACEDFLDWQGHWHDWAATQRTALDAARRLGDLGGQARTRRGLAGAYTQLGRHDDARGHLRQALDLYTRLEDATGQAHTHLNLARISVRQEHYDEALSHAHRALNLYRVDDHRAGQADALNAVGWYHAQLGDYQPALACCEQALTLHGELNNPHGQAETWDSLGYAHHQLGDYQQAVTCYQNGLSLYRKLGDRYFEACILDHLGDTHQMAGDAQAARHSWRQAFTILDQLGHPDAEKVGTRLNGLDLKNQCSNGEARSG